MDSPRELPKLVDVDKFLDAFQTEIDAQEFAINGTEWAALLKSIKEALIYASADEHE